MSSLIQIVYVSTISKTFKLPDVDEILAKARLQNSISGITGILLFADNDFIQVLEGPKVAVEHLYRAIARDPRHTGVHILYEREINERNFKNWAMGFERIEANAALPDVFAIGREPLEARMTDASRTMVMAFLTSFYRVSTNNVL